MDYTKFLLKIIFAGAVGIAVAYFLTYMIDHQLVYVSSIAAALIAYSVLDIYIKK
jgi:hypothetical protein